MSLLFKLALTFVVGAVVGIYTAQLDEPYDGAGALLFVVSMVGLIATMLVGIWSS